MQWTPGGWFGGQLGATAWIGLAALLSAARDPATGLILLVLFAAPNALGLWLWRTRRLSCYASTQVLIASVGVFGVLAVLVLESGGSWEQIQSGGAVSAMSACAVVAAAAAALMVMFYLRFGRSRTNDPD